MTHLTRVDLLRYVGTLDRRVARLFFEADSVVVQSADTLSEEFQIAADVVVVFERRARQFLGAPAEGTTHLAAPPFVAACGADEPNQSTTEIRDNVTCPCCVGKHDWAGQRLGGPPDEAASAEWVRYCRDCGAEPQD